MDQKNLDPPPIQMYPRSRSGGNAPTVHHYTSLSVKWMCFELHPPSVDRLNCGKTDLEEDLSVKKSHNNDFDLYFIKYEVSILYSSNVMTQQLRLNSQRDRHTINNMPHTCQNSMTHYSFMSDIWES